MDAVDPAPVARTALRWLLATFLGAAGVAHLTVQREEFLAQVPSWIPIEADVVVVVSGIVEIVLGTALVATPFRYRALVGWVVAVFFVAIFPGNVAQWADGTDAFGLDTDLARFVRLFFQPVLIAWALYATGAWQRRAELAATWRRFTA